MTACFLTTWLGRKGGREGGRKGGGNGGIWKRDSQTPLGFPPNSAKPGRKSKRTWLKCNLRALLPNRTYFPNHAIPLVVDLLPVLPVGHQVEVVGELDGLGEFLQDVDAEAFAALLHVLPFLRDVAGGASGHRKKPQMCPGPQGMETTSLWSRNWGNGPVTPLGQGLPTEGGKERDAGGWS